MSIRLVINQEPLRLREVEAFVFGPELGSRLRAVDAAVLASDRPLELTEEVPVRGLGLRQWMTFKFPIRQVSGDYTPAESPLFELRCDLTDVGTMWIHCGRCFVAVVDKQKAGDEQDEGVYVWNWYGFGGTAGTGYTPRNKPAAAEVRRLLHEF